MINQDALFGRSYQVILGTPLNPAQATYGNVGAECTPLRVAFSVEKNAKGTPNKASISIFNMAPNNRASIVPGMLVTLAVGYTSGLQNLFVGVVDTPKSKKPDTSAKATVLQERQGADIVTTLECLDGGSAITQTSFSRSYDRGVTLVQLLSDIASSMQLATAANPTGLTAGVALGIPAVTYSKGFTISGPCSRLLRTLCKPQGLEWSIQDGALNIVPLRHHTGQQAEVLNIGTGLVGVPSWNGKLLQFSALMNPRLAPGRLVQVQSNTVDGFFKIRTGKWEGDSHGDKWSCDLEGVALPHAQQALQAASGFGYTPTVDVG